MGASGLPELQRNGIAKNGLQAAADTRQVVQAAKFLAQIHSAFPEMDGEVEDAIVPLLQNAHADAEKYPEGTPTDERGGSELLALLAQIDPERAQRVRAEYPSASTAPSNNGVIQVSSTGKIAGISFGPDPTRSLLDMAPNDPENALAGAAKITDKDTRFGALAGIAKALAQSHPRQAQQTAGDAYALLDKEVALAESGFVADLAEAFYKLGEAGRAAEVAGLALDAANTHAEQADDQFDLSTPEGAAQAQAPAQLNLPALFLTAAYEQVAAFEPDVALAHARSCDCSVIKPLILAKVAEGMKPAPAAAH